MVYYKRIITPFLVLLLLETVFFISFALDSFSFRQSQARADAIVVLTGGRGRVEEGIRLYRERQGEWLFLIGVDPSVRRRDLYRERPGESRDEKVVLEKVSRNTLENAFYARELILGNRVGSIRLLTSRYHMKRAVLIFEHVLPKGIVIQPHPVDSRNLHEEWWSHGGSLRLLLSEFYKYQLYRIFFLVGASELRGVSGQ